MNKKRCSLILCFVSLLVLIPSLRAQADYTANQTTRIQVGVGVLYLKPDYTELPIKGVSFWGDYDFWKFVGVEVSGHLGNLITPADVAENSYMFGPRFVYHWHKATAYGKLMIGRGTITNQDYNLSSSYNLVAYGGGIEYKVLHKINIRALDFELQNWPDFAPNALSPLAVSVGVSYIIK